MKEHELSGRWRARRRAGAVEHAGDGVDDLEDAHAAAALSADGDVDGEHAGEEAGPVDAARALGSEGSLGSSRSAKSSGSC